MDVAWSIHREAALRALRASWVEEQMPAHGGELDRAIDVVTETLEDLTIRGEDIVGVEQRLRFRTPDGSIFIGYADLIHKLGPKSVDVLDWKVTSKKVPADELEHNFQLNMYGGAVRAMYPWAENVYGTHYYPPIQEHVRVSLSMTGYEEALARFEAVVEMVEIDERFAPRPGDYCADCVFQAECPAMGAVPTDQLKI